MLSKCEATVRRSDDSDLAVIELVGEVDGSASAVLMAAYDEAMAGAGFPRVLLDFTGVDYINSTGIALVVGVLARARSEQRAVLACGLSEHYRQIFAITRLSDFMELYDDRAAVLSAAG